jgi:Flp pilus assembly protein TadD
LSEYRKVCAETPWDWRSQISLGNALVERGELDQAIKHLEKAVEIKPKEELAHLVLAVAQERKGDLDRAISEHREVHRTSILGSNRKAAADKVKELEKRQKASRTG